MVYDKWNIFRVILYMLASIVCTLLLGGANWHNCILPMLLLLPIIINDRKNLFNNIWNLSLICLLLLGFISICVTRGDKQNALYNYIKFIYFILAVYVGLSEKKRTNILYCIFICSSLIAIIGLLSYCNLIKITEFTFNDRYILRLQSLLRYANTTALLLGCGYFAALELFEETQKAWIRFLSFCILLAFYLTFSKAAIPIFLLLGTFLIIKSNKFISAFVIPNVVCMFITVLILFENFKHWQTVKLITIVVCVMLCNYIMKSARFKRFHTDKRLIWLWGIGFNVFGIIICIIYLSKDMNILRTLFLRFDYMLDACKLLKNNWLMGIGPGAWKYYQYSVQATSYSLTDIHNSWLQILIEYGACFLIIFVGLIAKSIVHYIKYKQWIFLFILVFIAAHSLIDFNFSYGLVLMILGLLCGNTLQTGKRTKISIPIFYTVISICVALTGYIASEYIVRSNFERAYLSNDKEKAFKWIMRLEKMCPYDSELQISIATFEVGNVTERVERARMLSPLEPEFLKIEIDNLINNSDKSFFEKCKEYINSASKQEKTYVDVKKFLKAALQNNLCTQAEYDEYFAYVEDERIKNNVIDRNELLKSITTNGKEKGE